MKTQKGNHRYFYHSFPRRKAGEPSQKYADRAVEILSFMTTHGMVLAPEIVSWDVSLITLPAEPKFEVLQQRACFTEIAPDELKKHSEIFGYISLEFDIDSLRKAGAVPVIYVPQADKNNFASHLAAFAIRGSFYSRMMFDKISNLEELCDPQRASQRFGAPVFPNYTINLSNTDPEGNHVNQASVEAEKIRQVLTHLTYNDIPFRHSARTLSIFESMFYPTDNEHRGDILGYYRQREWRFVNSRVAFEGHSLCRSLTPGQKEGLIQIDPDFWAKTLTFRGESTSRVDAALLYQPNRDWSLINAARRVFAPEMLIDRVRNIVGDKATVVPA